ncbi:UNVERIFIED_ORG: hypothetical protein BDU10_3097 [Burkholderia sp. CF145]
MKGKSEFTVRDADGIRELLRQVREAGPQQQKLLRNRLRSDYKFYISDFSRSKVGFTTADFDALAERGTITIR